MQKKEYTPRSVKDSTLNYECSNLKYVSKWKTKFAKKVLSHKK